MIGSTFRVVFDCNIFWRAFFHRAGIGHECYKLVINESVRHYVSDETVEELLEVLAREDTLSKFPEYDLDDVEEFVNDIVYIPTYVQSVKQLMHLARDIDDEPYLNLAISVRANYLVTTDNDLLDIMTGTDFESKKFRQRFRGLKIVRPDEFLRVVNQTEISLKP